MLQSTRLFPAEPDISTSLDQAGTRGSSCNPSAVVAALQFFKAFCAVQLERGLGIHSSTSNILVMVSVGGVLVYMRKQHENIPKKPDSTRPHSAAL